MLDRGVTVASEGAFQPRPAGVQSRIWRELIRLGVQHMINPELPVEVRRRRMRLLDYVTQLPGGTRVMPVVAGSVPAEWVIPRHADPGRALLYVHGGAYVAGSPASHRAFVARLAKIVGARALVPDYRLAPEHRFPCAVEDVRDVYRWLLEEQGIDPDRLVVVGDSAGGGLTLALAVSVRDDGRLRLPRALGCVAPWTDLAGTGESMRSRAPFDTWYQPAGLAIEARRYLGEVDPKHPLASPLYADLRDLPPLLAQVGEDDVLLDDSRRLVERARAAGVDANLEVWPGMWHVFQMNAAVPEARQAQQRLGRFLRHHLTQLPE